MFTLSVPGTSVPGSAHPDAIVAGTRIDVVEALLSAGMDNVVMACSGDALLHALRCATGEELLVVLDSHAASSLLSALRRAPALLGRCIILVQGMTLAETDRAILKNARATLWCDDALLLPALARAARHRCAA